MTGVYDGMTAILYARVSTDDKDQTTETQVRNMKAWCEEQGVSIIGVYEEEKSAKDLDRPKFDACLGRIMRGGVNILLAWNESRLTRDMEDMAKITKTIRPYGTVIRYVSNGIEPEQSAGKLLNSINAWQSEEERKKLSLNTKVGMDTARAHGIHCGRYLAFCWSHRVAEYASKIAKEERGMKPTKIVSVDTVMDFARQGYTVSGASRLIGVSNNTLKSALVSEGLFEEYTRILHDVKKGVVEKRVSNTPENVETRGGY